MIILPSLETIAPYSSISCFSPKDYYNLAHTLDVGRNSADMLKCCRVCCSPHTTLCFRYWHLHSDHQRHGCWESSFLFWRSLKLQKLYGVNGLSEYTEPFIVSCTSEWGLVFITLLFTGTGNQKGLLHGFGKKCKSFGLSKSLVPIFHRVFSALYSSI